MANFMKVGDVAAELRVSEQAVRMWCRTGVLPAIRPAGTKKWLIDPEAFDQWLGRSPVKSVIESLTADYRDSRSDDELAEEFLNQRAALMAESDPDATDV